MSNPKLDDRLRNQEEQQPQIQFISRLSLNECVVLLKQLQEGSIFASTRVYIKVIDEHYAYYELRKWYAFNFIAKVDGELVSENINSTRISGEATVNTWILVFSIFMMFATPTLALISIIHGQLLTIPLLLIVFVIARFNQLQLLRSRRKLLNTLVDALK